MTAETTTRPATEIFDVYQDAYMDIRARHQHPDEPVLYGGRWYVETIPPRGWDRDTYSAYFDEVTRLAGWYRAARHYGAKRRKSSQDRAAYDEACDRYAVAGKGLRFAGEPEPALF